MSNVLCLMHVRRHEGVTCGVFIAMKTHKLTFETVGGTVLRRECSFVLNLHSIPLFNTKGPVSAQTLQKSFCFYLRKNPLPAAVYGVFETFVENELLKDEVAKQRKMMKALRIHILCTVASGVRLRLTLAPMQAANLVD